MLARFKKNIQGKLSLRSKLLEGFIKLTSKDGKYFVEYISGTVQYGCKCELATHRIRYRKSKPQLIVPCGHRSRTKTCKCTVNDEEKANTYKEYWHNGKVTCVPLSDFFTMFIDSADIVPLDFKPVGGDITWVAYNKEDFQSKGANTPYDKNALSLRAIKEAKQTKTTNDLLRSIGF